VARISASLEGYPHYHHYHPTGDVLGDSDGKR
jgi:hypothetical protein